MKAQRIKAGGKLIAIRVFHEPDAKIQRGKAIVPIPELGAMACNFETFTGQEIRSWQLETPEAIDGIKAALKAEAWATRNGKPAQLRETWYLERTPKGHKTAADFVGAWLEAEARQLDREAARRNPPVMANKGAAESVDIRQSTRAALLTMMREQFPQTFVAMKAGHDDETTFRAYAADVWARRGSLDADTLAQLAGDKSFTHWLKLALAKPGSVDPWKWKLACGWIQNGWHALDDDALAALLNEWTGEARTPKAWRKAAQRIGLVSSRRPGAPELHPVLLPKE